MRSTILTRCANGPADKGVIPVRPTLQTEIKLFGRHKGGAMKIGACARRTKTLRAPQASGRSAAGEAEDISASGLDF
jgi:hypothetical protein